MIYLKNNTEPQSIYIPRQTVLGGGYVATTKTYEDGLMEGIEKGKEIQKDQLLNLYVTENGQYEREDGWGVVTVDVPTEGGGDCSEAYNKGFEDGYKQGQSECEEVDCSGAYNDGYNSGYQEGYNQGQAECPTVSLENGSFTASSNGEYNITPSEGFDGLESLNLTVDVPTCKLTTKSVSLSRESATIRASDEGVDGYSEVTIAAWPYGDVRYTEGYDKGYKDGQNDCPDLTEITITENGRYEGAYNVVNVDIDTQAYYNQGFADATSFDKIAMEIETDIFSKLEFLTDRSFVTTSGENSPKSLMFDMPINYIWSYRDVNDGIAQLKQNAFRDYGSIRKVKLNTIMTLGERAFKDAFELREIEMSSLIGRIATEAFDGCSKLAKIICRATGGVVLGSAPFNGLPENGVLYLEEGIDETPWLEKLPSGWVVERN